MQYKIRRIDIQIYQTINYLFYTTRERELFIEVFQKGVGLHLKTSKSFPASLHIHGLETSNVPPVKKGDWEEVAE